MAHSSPRRSSVVALDQSEALACSGCGSRKLVAISSTSRAGKGTAVCHVRGAQGAKGPTRGSQHGAVGDCRGDLPNGRSIRIKLFVGEGQPMELQLPPEAAVASVFREAAVLRRLREAYGGEVAAARPARSRFLLQRGAPEPKSYGGALAARTSLREALGAAGGVLRVRPRPGLAPRRRPPLRRAPAARGLRAGGRVLPAGVAAGLAGCDGVRVLRFCAPDSGIASPVVLVKNFNRDRGVLLASIAGLRPMVEMAPKAMSELTRNVRSELAAYPQGEAGTREVQRASERVMDICQHEVRHDQPAKDALAKRTAYSSTAVLIYDKHARLPRHVDNCGSWVILFSFGNTVDFFCGDQAVAFESGDALVFNGGKQHAVRHGIDWFRTYATVKDGKRRKLPNSLDYLRDLRVSFQARQCTL